MSSGGGHAKAVEIIAGAPDSWVGQARRGTDSVIDLGSVELQATNLLQVCRPAVDLGT